MPKGNFSDEIKKGMGTDKGAVAKPQQKNAKSSTNDSPGGNPPANAGKFNRAPAPSAPMQPNMAQAAAPVDTMQAMQDAGNAHMQAIHNHINSLKGGM